MTTLGYGGLLLLIFSLSASFHTLPTPVIIINYFYRICILFLYLFTRTVLRGG